MRADGEIVRKDQKSDDRRRRPPCIVAREDNRRYQPEREHRSRKRPAAMPPWNRCSSAPNTMKASGVFSSWYPRNWSSEGIHVVLNDNAVGQKCSSSFSGGNRRKSRETKSARYSSARRRSRCVRVEAGELRYSRLVRCHGRSHAERAEEPSAQRVFFVFKKDISARSAPLRAPRGIVVTAASIRGSSSVGVGVRFDRWPGRRRGTGPCATRGLSRPVPACRR